MRMNRCSKMTLMKTMNCRNCCSMTNHCLMRTMGSSVGRAWALLALSILGTSDSAIISASVASALQDPRNVVLFGEHQTTEDRHAYLQAAQEQGYACWMLPAKHRAATCIQVPLEDCSKMVCESSPAGRRCNTRIDYHIIRIDVDNFMYIIKLEKCIGAFFFSNSDPLLYSTTPSQKSNTPPSDYTPARERERERATDSTPAL